MTRTLDDTIMDMEAYISQLKGRMAKGNHEYKEISFSKDPEELIQEIQEELLDVSNWGFILWQRLERIREVMKCLTSENET